MNTKDCLASLEMLRDFVAKFVPLDTYMKNLIIDHIETSSRRLWAFRESLGIDEVNFAHTLDISFEDYHLYEHVDSAVPRTFLESVSAKFSVPIEWLLCKCPMLPIPKPKKAE